MAPSNVLRAINFQNDLMSAFGTKRTLRAFPQSAVSPAFPEPSPGKQHHRKISMTIASGPKLTTRKTVPLLGSKRPHTVAIFIRARAREAFCDERLDRGHRHLAAFAFQITFEFVGFDELINGIGASIEQGFSLSHADDKRFEIISGTAGHHYLDKMNERRG
jgi:hypothetical protein